MFNKFLDPKNDVAFKKIFGTEKNQDILIRFLNDVISFKEKRPIVSVTFLPTIQDPETVAKKTSIVDILCKDEEGSTYIVEMQVAKSKGFEKRAQFYAAKAYCSQSNKGDPYFELKEVIFVAIADYVMFPEKKDYKSDHVILDKKTYEHDLKDFSFTFIELPKFNKSLDELSSLQEQWCYFFKHADDTSEKELEQLIKRDPIFKKVYGELNRAYWSEEEMLKYEHSEKQTKDYVASLEQKFDEGISIGIEKGIVVGIEKGIVVGIEKGIVVGIEKGKAEGRAEGKAEGKAEAKKEMARDALKQNIPMDSICLITGLSKEELEELKDN